MDNSAMNDNVAVDIDRKAELLRKILTKIRIEKDNYAEKLRTEINPLRYLELKAKAELLEQLYLDIDSEHLRYMD